MDEFKMTTLTVEPFGYFRPEPFGWEICAADDEGAIALYEAPPEYKPLTNEQLAAPELLAALQGMLRGIFDGPDDASAAMLVAKARAAIAKAKGEKE